MWLRVLLWHNGFGVWSVGWWWCGALLCGGAVQCGAVCDVVLCMGCCACTAMCHTSIGGVCAKHGVAQQDSGTRTGGRYCGIPTDTVCRCAATTYGIGALNPVVRVQTYARYSHGVRVVGWPRRVGRFLPRWAPRDPGSIPRLYCVVHVGRSVRRTGGIWAAARNANGHIAFATYGASDQRKMPRTHPRKSLCHMGLDTPMRGNDSRITGHEKRCRTWMFQTLRTCPT